MARTSCSKKQGLKQALGPNLNAITPGESSSYEVETTVDLSKVALLLAMSFLSFVAFFVLELLKRWGQSNTTSGIWWPSPMRSS